MKVNKTALRRSFDEPEWTAAQVAASPKVEDSDSDARRSARNILVWKTYLPPDCIKTMIAMHWDITT